MSSPHPRSTAGNAAQSYAGIAERRLLRDSVEDPAEVAALSESARAAGELSYVLPRPTAVRAGPGRGAAIRAGAAWYRANS